MGEREMEGTVQSRLNDIQETIYGDDGMIIAFVNTEANVNNIQNNILPDMKSDLNQAFTTNENQWEYINDHEKKIKDIDNKLTQIDVNTADMKVVQAQVKSMQAQIEQIRTECNNNIANCMNAIEALTEKVDLMKLKLDQL